jgi:hypothetical protein
MFNCHDRGNGSIDERRKEIPAGKGKEYYECKYLLLIKEIIMVAVLS